MDGTEAFTTLHFALMGLLAALVLVAIVVGVRKQRALAAAEREVEAHAVEAGVEVSPAAPVLSREPLSPPPSPIADPLAPGTQTTEAATPLADEPIATAIAPDGTTAADATASDTHSPADGSVTQLKGLGPKVAARLGELGIDRVGQLAALDDAQAAELDAAMGPFQGRMARDRWIEQARLLAAGDRDGFERVFGKL